METVRMQGRIMVKRIERPEKRGKSWYNGREFTHPAFWSCTYFWEGKEIAFRGSQYGDALYLNSRYLANDRSLSYPERMKRSPEPEMWEELFEDLGFSEDMLMSEYI